MVPSPNNRVFDTFTRQNCGSAPPFTMQRLLEETNRTGIGFVHVIVVFTITPRVTVYKYYIPERVIVRNVTLRNVIINRGTAEVDNHISKGTFLSPCQECNIYFIIRNV